MAKVPYRKLLKREMIWLGEHLCKKHSTSYLSHYQCFLDEKPEDCPFWERVGFLDLECSNLHADFGMIFSYAIKELDGEIIGRVVTQEEMLSYKFDRDLVAEAVDNLKKFHRIVVHYGKPGRFDIPFLKTRALLYGIDFPKYKEIYVEDTYDMAKRNLRLHRNRLESICEFFDIPAKAHKMSPKMWQRAQSGDPKALDWVWKHNVEDVESLEKVWKLLNEFEPRRNTSV